jgi:hypothetical protein
MPREGSGGGSDGRGSLFPSRISSLSSLEESLGLRGGLDREGCREVVGRGVWGTERDEMSGGVSSRERHEGRAVSSSQERVRASGFKGCVTTDRRRLSCE